MAHKNWPHPVLDASSGDYPDCAFQARFEVRQTRLEFAISVGFDLGSDTLNNRVQAGEAEFAVQIACPRTAYRATHAASSAELQMSVPEHELRDGFTLAPFLISRKPLVLSDRELSPMFHGLAFHVEPGAILAIAPPAEYFADKVFDELKNISAIFHVVKHVDKDNDAVEYDLNGNKIAIFLPHDVYENYRLFRSRTPYRELFACSLVIPGLAVALESLRADDTDGINIQRWKRVLRRKLATTGRGDLGNEETFRLAQVLLEYPFGRALSAIRKRECEEGGSR